jgi:LytS/YehU family sensor histidine kinase
LLNCQRKFESLNQIDPTFSFNSLNVLSSLIEEIQKMRNDLRSHYQRFTVAVLEQKTAELVTVQEELALQTYMNLI